MFELKLLRKRSLRHGLRALRVDQKEVGLAVMNSPQIRNNEMCLGRQWAAGESTRSIVQPFVKQQD